MKHISIIGSTGSIGQQALDVIRHHKDEFTVTALVAHSNIDQMEKDVLEFSPKLVGMVNETAYEELKRRLPEAYIIGGKEALQAAAEQDEAEYVLTALVGAAGIEPTVQAIKKQKKIALANKETLVAGGPLIRALCDQYNVPLLPVDSEHSAIFQCLEGQNKVNVDSLIITASGGPLRKKTREEIIKARPEDCLAHPTWNMGQKITIDSATLFNKGLEVMEAHWLFGFDYEHIKVVVHPQSLIHSMIQMKDGALLAQIGSPDMREPIQYALSYPHRLPLEGGASLDFSELIHMTFEPPRRKDFPALSLAYEVGRKGGFYPAVFNGANEVAVYAFLQHAINFPAIYEIVYNTIEAMPQVGEFNLENLLYIDRWARQYAQSLV